MRLQRVLVDLDPEAGPGGRVEHPVAQLALDRGDRRGEEALGGEAVGEPGGRGPRRRRRAPVRVEPRRRSRPGRRGRWRRRRAAPRRSPAPRPSPPTLESLIPVRRRPRASRDRRASLRAGDALVAGERDRGRRSPARRRCSIVATGCSTSSISSGSSAASVRRAVSRSQAALASIRIRAPRPERLAHRPHLADVVADPQLQLEGARSPRRPSVRRVGGDGRRLARDQRRVARNRTEGAASRESSCPFSPSGLTKTGGRLSLAPNCAPRSQSAVSAAQRAGAESAAAVDVPFEVTRVELRRRSQRLQLAYHVAQRRPAAQRERHRFAQPDQTLGSRAGAAAPSRAACSVPRAVT